MNAQIVDIDDPRVVKALAHPIRMKILGILDERTATPKELAGALGLPLENVSYHVRTLKDFGFIKLEKTRQVRGAVEHHYKLAARPQIGNKLWEEIPRVMQEALIDANLSAFIEDLGRAAMEGGFDLAEANLANYSLILDEEGVKEVDAILREAEDRIEQASQKAQKRTKDGVDTRRMSFMAFFFEQATRLPPERAAARRDATRTRRAKSKSTA
ncbi:MAG: helix-turn-helix domain-containing protein [Actinomycetota bacterium]|nr:helix-turn-helix domain-containing protein [Actinomycetota bacterium]MDQ5807576.1 helix-turn-helix domain-containing protein [Actinomycetota bacterium]